MMMTLGRTLSATAVAVGLVSVPVQLIYGDLPFELRPDLVSAAISFAVAAIGFGLVAWLTLPTQSENRLVWLFTASASFTALAAFGTILVSLSWPDELTTVDVIDTVTPAQLPAVGSIGVLIIHATWVPGLFLVLIVGLLLFPDGRPLAGWGWLVKFNCIAISVTSLLSALAALPNGTQPIARRLPQYFDGGIIDAAAGLMFVLLTAGGVLSVIVLGSTYRDSSGTRRRQIQWIAFGGGAIFVGGVLRGLGLLGPALAGTVIFFACFYVAITKYRLYDLTVVVSKAVAYFSLAAAMVLLYGGAVFGYIALFGDEHQRETGDLGVALPIGATLLVAISFAPLRQWLQSFADRLVYGRRAAPHEVLSQLTVELADTSSRRSLNTLARLLAEGTAAESATVWLRVGERLRAEAAFPIGSRTGRNRSIQEENTATELELSVPVRRGDDVLGLLEITKNTAHAVTPADIDLLTDVAASAGLLLNNMRLNAELESRAHQLQDSRRRLIAAHDEVRHRLERDLHDGAQQQVVALKVKLGLARTIAEREGAGDIAVLLEGLADDTDDAVNAMRQVARGIYPPLLEAEGLATALKAWSRTASVETHLSVDIHGRHRRAVEETVYFSVIHAIGAAAAAGAQVVRACLFEDEAGIDITIGHDARYSLDMTPLVDRVDAHDGSIAVEPQRMAVTVPVAREVAV